MQRAFVTDTHFVTGRRMMAGIIVALLVSLVLAMAPAAHAQESTPDSATPEATPAATPAAGATPEADVIGDVLMTYDFDAMPQAPMTVRLLRITLAPGANVPMHTHPGPEFDYVESGTLTARIDGTAVVSIDGEQSDVSDAQTLSTGSWIMYPDGVGMSLANEGEEDVVLLSAVILSVGGENQSTITYTEGEPTDSDFEGVSFVVLGDGLIQQFPDSPSTVTVDQLTLGPGQAIPAFSGAALVSKASGTLEFTAVEGQVQVTRTATPQLQPNAIPGQEFTLGNNDAAFFPAGYETIDRSGSTDELSLLRLLIQPEGELASAAAVVAPLSSGDVATTTEQTSEAEGDGLGVGAIIAINTDDVRVRAEATTESDIVGTYTAGTQFELIDGPVEGEDYTWYQVRGLGDLADVEGWLVTDFMDVIEPAPAGAQSGESDDIDTSIIGDVLTGAVAGDSTPAADATGELTVGAIVVTTEENVRIRAEGNAGAEIFTTLPLGTELEIIGGPTEADGFVWYEVEVVGEGITGWTAGDFLELADAEE